MPKLYIVATPIGNLQDLSPRMREALETCDLVAAEDTRVTMKLLQVLGIHKPMLSCHRHNEEDRGDELIDRMLQEDLCVALTCDAGTPGISDPGEGVVARAWEAGIELSPVSGPSAVATALSVCGFDTREFAFYGFLPRESKALKEKLSQIYKTGIPVAVLYESPHRVVKLLGQIAESLPGARACVCCDLSKKFERIDRGEIAQVHARLAGLENVEKGEYCVVLDLSGLPVPQAERAPDEAQTPELQIAARILAGESPQDALEALKRSGVRRNDLYRASLNLKRLAQTLLSDEQA